MITIYDQDQAPAGVQDSSGEIYTMDTESGAILQGWLDSGVPGMVGHIVGSTIVDVPTLMPPDDPLFGLALLDHFDRIGWATSGEGAELIDNAFCPTGPGGGQDNSCGSSTQSRYKANPYSRLTPITNGKVRLRDGHDYDAEALAKFAASLTKEEEALIKYWKDEDDATTNIRNSFLRNDLGSYERIFLRAISKSPPYQGIVYRGLKGKYANELGDKLHEQIGKKWSDPSGPHGCTIRSSVAHAFSGADLLFRIQTKTARPIQNIGRHTSEKECVGMPGTKYLIKDVNKDVTVRGDVSTKARKIVKYVVDLVEI